MHNAHIARDISYAHSARSPAGRMVIRTLENATGRIGLIRRANGYADEVAAGRDFWRVMMDRYGLRLEVLRGSLENIPETGPLVLIANHPYGILDGLVMGYLLSSLRQGRFHILAHSVFRKAPELERVILPIDFGGTPEAAQSNIETRARAVEHVCGGGAVGIFPGGTVSTAARPLETPMDPAWRGFTSRLITRSDAQVVPIWFEGHNSRLFQLASHMHYTLRMALLLREFRNRLDRPVRMVIGKPLCPEQIARHSGNGKEMMDFLRRATYDLAPETLDTGRYGFEFEETHKR